MHVQLTVLLSLVLFAHPSEPVVPTATIPEPELVVELRFSVPGDSVLRLDQIVSAKVDVSGAWERLRGLRVAVPGDRVTRGDVLRRLQDAGVPARCVQVDGPAIALRGRKAQP